MVALADIF